MARKMGQIKTMIHLWSVAAAAAAASQATEGEKEGEHHPCWFYTDQVINPFCAPASFPQSKKPDQKKDFFGEIN